MLESLADFLAQNGLQQPDQPIVLGVSGGLDSMAALHAFHKLAIPLVCAHFDHGLRPESGSDLAFVRKAADRLGVPFVAGAGNVEAYRAAEGLSVEEAARELRYRFLFQTARTAGAQAVATAHTADDQAETVLMHFLRGSGLSGLKGMRPVTILPVFDAEIPLVRPFLEVSRTELADFCRREGIGFIEDASNRDPAYFRNRLRHNLLPELETYQPAVRRILQRTAAVLAQEDAALREVLDERWGRLCIRTGAGFVGLDRAEFASLPEGLKGRALRRAVFALDPAQRDIDFDAVRRALKTAAGSPGAVCDLCGGLKLLVEEDALWVAADRASLPTDLWPQVPGDAPILLPVPGAVRLGDSWELQVARMRISEAGTPDENTLFLPDRFADRGLMVRGRMPGDRMQPARFDGHTVRISDLMINMKLPRRARARWPLLFSGERLLWVVGLRAAEGLQPVDDAEWIVRLTLSRR